MQAFRIPGVKMRHRRVTRDALERFAREHCPNAAKEMMARLARVDADRAAKQRKPQKGAA
jgi:hypothetical protein